MCVMSERGKKKIIECVPNFSEGRNPKIIYEIVATIEEVDGVLVAGVESGKATNRTVITFFGEPGPVVEAAFQAIKKASEIIDMAQHRGEHPRFGATDVCPLVPVANIEMDEVVELARQLAKRVGEELQIPVYCYENAAFKEERKSLAYCRMGGYEVLKIRMESTDGKPDFGPHTWPGKVVTSGAVAIGARNFLVAYNINLKTNSVAVANAIAADIRESGRVLREGDPVAGKIMRNEDGTPVRIPGSLKKTRAMGWYIKEYGIAQVSMNLMDINVTPVHIAFDEVVEKARMRGVKVTGSELIGLIPLKALIDAGKHYLKKQNLSAEISDEEIVEVAIQSLGLRNLNPFDPKMKIVECFIELGTL